MTVIDSIDSRHVGTISLEAYLRGNPTGPNGAYHAFNDQLTIGIGNRAYDSDFGLYRYVRAGQRLPVEIGGVRTTMVEAKGPDDYGGVQKVDIPVTVPSGQHTVTVDGVDVGTIRVYNPDMPPAGEPAESDVPGTTDTPEQSGQSESEQPAASTPTTEPEQSETTGQGGRSDSGQQGSTVTRKTAAAAGIAALALLIWAR